MKRRKPLFDYLESDIKPDCKDKYGNIPDAFQNFLDHPSVKLNKKLKKEIETKIWNIIESYDRHLEYDLEYHLNDSPIIRAARNKIANSCVKALKDQMNSFEHTFSFDLLYSKRKIYPHKWMTVDKKIKDIFKRYPLIVPLLNYLFNYNRYLRGEDFKRQIKFNDEKIGHKYKSNGKKYEYSTFITDKDFYDEITHKLKCSKRTIQSYLNAFVYMGILSNWRFGNNRWIYADGYFSKYGDRLRKRHFLTEKKHKMELRDLPNYIESKNK
jgi:hypothetical protein